MEKPAVKPQCPHFSSGPCAKRPGWTPDVLANAFLGRSHRAAPCKKKLQDVIEQHRALLGIPADYKIGIVPASDTGAVEMALWSLLGPRPVDVFAWESFGSSWASDIQKQLKIASMTLYDAPYGVLPDLTKASPDHDLVFTWNGTTSGVCVPDAHWISDRRNGLTICDATSAVFAYEMPWDKLDVTTWSWQKILGGEGAHGMIVLSPRTVERLETYTPPWPMPKIFRMTKDGQIIDGIFQGETINTPSMMAVEDCLDALAWVERIGGRTATIKRTSDNFQTVSDWVNATPWVDFLAKDTSSRSRTSVCLSLDIPAGADAKSFVKSLVGLLDQEGIAYDINAYRDAPAGLRLWCGATVEQQDIAALFPWIEWAYHTVSRDL